MYVQLWSTNFSEARLGSFGLSAMTQTEPSSHTYSLLQQQTCVKVPKRSASKGLQNKVRDLDGPWTLCSHFCRETLETQNLKIWICRETLEIQYLNVPISRETLEIQDPKLFCRETLETQV